MSDNLSNRTDFLGFESNSLEFNNISSVSEIDVNEHMSRPQSIASKNTSRRSSIESQKSRPNSPQQTNIENTQIMDMFQTLMTKITEIKTNNDNLKQELTQELTQQIKTNNANLTQTMNDRFNKLEREMKEQSREVGLKLGKVNDRLDNVEVDVQTKHDLCVKLVNDKFSLANNEVKKNRDKTVEVEARVQVVESSLKAVEKESRDELVKAKKSVDRCTSKQNQFEERYDNEAVVVTNRIESLEIERIVVTNRIDLLEKDRPNLVKQIEQLNKKVENKLTSAGIINYETKSLSAISANAELFLVNFENEQSGIHPMTFLKYVDKFVEVSGDNWQIQLLNIIKYLKGEPEAWARQHIDKFNDFDSFRSEFKKKYWGVIRQRQFEHELMGQGNFNISRLDLATYVSKYFEINKMLDKPMSIDMFLNYMCKHVPESLGAAIQTVMTVKNITNESEMETMCKNIGIVREKESLPVNPNKYHYNKGNKDFYNKHNNEQPNKRDDRELKTQVAEIVESNSTEPNRSENEKKIETRDDDRTDDRERRYSNYNGNRGRGHHNNYRGGRGHYSDNYGNYRNNQY